MAWFTPRKAEKAGINSNQAWTGEEPFYSAALQETLSSATAYAQTHSDVLVSHAVPRAGYRQRCSIAWPLSYVFDSNTLLIKPLTPSVTCRFYFAKNPKQPSSSIANTTAHKKKEEQFVKITKHRAVNPNSLRDTSVHPWALSALLKHLCSLFPPIPPFYHLPPNNVRQHSHTAHPGEYASPVFVRLGCLESYSFSTYGSKESTWEVWMTMSPFFLQSILSEFTDSTFFQAPPVHFFPLSISTIRGEFYFFWT